jgi:Zn-dependent protease with chaperone function
MGTSNIPTSRATLELDASNPRLRVRSTDEVSGPNRTGAGIPPLRTFENLDPALPAPERLTSGVVRQHTDPGRATSTQRVSRVVSREVLAASLAERSQGQLPSPSSSSRLLLVVATLVVGVGIAGATTLKRTSVVVETSWERPAQIALLGQSSNSVGPYVDTVGQRLVKKNDIAARTFLVSDDKATGMYVLPSSIVVTAGLLSRLSTESQLAAVLAVGLAHIERGDPAKAFSATKSASQIETGLAESAAAAARAVGQATVTADDVVGIDADALKLLANTDYQLASFVDAWRSLRYSPVALAHPGPSDRERRMLTVMQRIGAAGSNVSGDAYRARVLDVIGRDLDWPMRTQQPDPDASLRLTKKEQP